MRIVFLTDIHDAFRPLETVLWGTSADLYVLAGDLIYRIFPRYQTAWRFIELQEFLAGHRAGPRGTETLQDVAERLCRESQGSSAHQAEEYLRLCARAEAAMHGAYEKMEEILARHPGLRIRVLPGNYDMDLRATVLRDRDLHLRCLEVEGWRIAGYGGADVYTPGIPDHLQVRFREERRGVEMRSQAREFFRSVRPHILVLHHPPYGHLDRLPGHGHVGSLGIRDYLDEARVALVLSGHLHEAWGAEWAHGTCYLNPSNFGRVMTVSRARPGGYFLDLILEAGRFQVATLRQVERGRIHDVADFRLSDGRLETLVLDEARHARMGGKSPRAAHMRPIRQFQRIKSFFLGYETPESKALVQELRGIYRRLRKDGMSVAFDLLGSLNFGMARVGSDLDLVVYLKGHECVPDELDACAVPRPLAAVFQELKGHRLEVEVCDSLDLDRVERAIREEACEDGQLQRFIFYRAVCRPVNLRLIKSVENQLLRKERFRREMEMRLREYLRILVSSVRHVRSFDKYLARLREAGVRVPAEVEMGIRKYLRG
jgi:Icc-related predicted phosphoesterase